MAGTIKNIDLFEFFNLSSTFNIPIWWSLWAWLIQIINGLLSNIMYSSSIYFKVPSPQSNIIFEFNYSLTRIIPDTFLYYPGFIEQVPKNINFKKSYFYCFICNNSFSNVSVIESKFFKVKF